MNVTFHYPPELFELLVETIPCLFKYKKSVIDFLRGAGVSNSVTVDIEGQLHKDRESVNKYSIVRTVLFRLNEAGESALRERREIVKRVCEFEDFSTGWPDDQLKARGLVAEIRNLVNKHDFFRRFEQQRESELQKHREEKRREAEKLKRHRQEVQGILKEIKSLVIMDDPHSRGKRFEKVMNDLFMNSGILVREAFVLVEEPGQGITEQLDGVIELDGHIYLVEVKWRKEPVDVTEVSRHISRVLTRVDCRGLIISESGYTAPAVLVCKQAMKSAPIVLCKLEEIVMMLESEKSIKEVLKAKTHKLIIEKQPLAEVL